MPCHLWRIVTTDTHGTGHRTRRQQIGKQGVERRHGGRRDGQPDGCSGKDLSMGTRRHVQGTGPAGAVLVWTCSVFSAEHPDAYFCNACFPRATSTLAPFFERLADGVLDHRETYRFGVIEQFSSNWKLSRMACVDRNVLRLAVLRLLFCGDIPAKVSINEAIDVGKKFGLRRIRMPLSTAFWTVSPTPSTGKN
jgi:transcription termination factor NusB